MWIFYGLLAGVLLGFYDFWTKKAMNGNDVIPIVFWSSLFGALAWLPAFLPSSENFEFYIDWSKTNTYQQIIILIKGLAMTSSWLFAYYSVKELPMSFSGAVRASGPLWTLAGGAILFGEHLSTLQFSAVMISIMAYCALSQIGKNEGILMIRSLPVFLMLAATILSGMTTVYDKFIVQNIGVPIYNVQAYSAFHRFFISFVIFMFFSWKEQRILPLQWSIYIPLVGLSWVGAELIYFFAISDPIANVTYLSIFRRTSLIVGFFLSIIFIGERYLLQKSIIMGIIIFSSIFLIIQR